MEERKGREKSGGQLSVIILILLICSTEEVYILAAIFSKSHGARYINFCISGWFVSAVVYQQNREKTNFSSYFCCRCCDQEMLLRFGDEFRQQKQSSLPRCWKRNIEIKKICIASHFQRSLLLSAG